MRLIYCLASLAILAMILAEVLGMEARFLP